MPGTGENYYYVKLKKQQKKKSSARERVRYQRSRKQEMITWKRKMFQEQKISNVCQTCGLNFRANFFQYGLLNPGHWTCRVLCSPAKCSNAGPHFSPLLFWDTASVSYPSWPHTRNPPASGSWVAGTQKSTTAPHDKWGFLKSSALITLLVNLHEGISRFTLL